MIILDKSQEEAIVTSMYSMSRDMFIGPPLRNTEHEFPMPIIVSAFSLCKDSNNTDHETTRRKSLIYYPTARCTCSECNEESFRKKARPSYPTDDIFTDSRNDASPESRQSTSSPDENSSLEGFNDTYPCLLCTMKFSKKIDLERHKLNHSADKAYKCQMCDRGFTWFGNFQKHMLSHGSESAKLHPYFTYNNAPEEDLLIRVDNNTFKCALCEKTFTRMSGLRTHIRMHNGLRPFTCSCCPLAFTTNRALKMHMRIHSGERPYKCTECKKSFTRKDELQAHVYLHKGIL